MRCAACRIASSESRDAISEPLIRVPPAGCGMQLCAFCSVLPAWRLPKGRRLRARPVMSRSLLSLATAVALLASGLTPSAAQEITQPSAQPVPILSGQSGGAGISGGTSSGGAAVPAPAPVPVAPAEPLPPGPPAGPQQAEFFANPAVIGSAAAVTAIIVCALVCFGRSSSTTTSTGVTHH